MSEPRLLSQEELNRKHAVLVSTGATPIVDEVWGHIAVLEAQLRIAQYEVAQMDAALRVRVPEIEALLSSTCVWCGTPAPQPTITETLRAHVTAHVLVCEGHPMRALEAEIARLTPSGQVAEDARAVLDGLASETHNGKWCAPTPDGIECPCEPLSRLAAGAQQAERLARALAYIQECEGGPHLLTEAGALAGDRVDEVRQELVEMTADHDAAQHTLSETLNKLDAATADNAALLDDLREASRGLSAPLIQRLQTTLDAPHPGAALLEEHRKALVRARNEGRRQAINAISDALTKDLDVSPQDVIATLMEPES